MATYYDDWTNEAGLEAGSAASARIVAGNGDILVVGEPDWSLEKGRVHIFCAYGPAENTWTLEQIIEGNAAGDRFGAAVAVLDATARLIAVGTPNDSLDAAAAGSVSVYARSGDWEPGGTWALEQRLVLSSPAAGDGLGSAVGITYDDTPRVWLAAGAPARTPGLVAGAGVVVLWARSGTTWTQHYEIASSDQVEAGAFGTRLAMSSPGLAARVIALQTATSCTYGAQLHTLTSFSPAAWALTKGWAPSSGAAMMDVAIDDAWVGWVEIGTPSYGTQAKLFELSDLDTAIYTILSVGNVDPQQRIALDQSAGIIVSGHCDPAIPLAQGVTVFPLDTEGTWRDPIDLVSGHSGEHGFGYSICTLPLARIAVGDLLPDEGVANASVFLGTMPGPPSLQLSNVTPVDGATEQDPAVVAEFDVTSTDGVDDTATTVNMVINGVTEAAVIGTSPQDGYAVSVTPISDGYNYATTRIAGYPLGAVVAQNVHVQDSLANTLDDTYGFQIKCPDVVVGLSEMLETKYARNTLTVFRIPARKTNGDPV